MGGCCQYVTGNGKTASADDHRVRRPACIYVHRNHEELVEYMTVYESLFLLASPSASQKDIFIAVLLTGGKQHE